MHQPIKVKIRILEQVLPLSARFKPSNECTAATGIRLQLTEQKGILSGMPFQTFTDEKHLIDLNKEVTESIKLDKQGIIIKADSLGSLEALLVLLKQENIKVSRAGIGSISKADILSARANLETNPLDAIILGFNVQEDEEAKETDKSNIKILEEEVIYKLIENLQKFRDEKTKEIQREKLMNLAMICKLRVLPEYIFHNSNPAVFGVKVEGGKLKQGIELINQDGEKIARIKAVQSEGKSVEEAKPSQEVAISLPGVNFERQLKDTSFLFSDMGEAQFREFKENKSLLSSEEISVLQEIARIKRKQKPTWGV